MRFWKTYCRFLLHALKSLFWMFLHRSGYGGHRDDLQRVGGTGDGGIDGVISLDKLGTRESLCSGKTLAEHCRQARITGILRRTGWAKKAKRGVFITTSGFTSQARDFAQSVEGMVLVDGERPVHLMIENEVGVSSRLLKVPKLDMDYF
ncbi:restriction endonuclease [Escherichia coli]